MVGILMKGLKMSIDNKDEIKQAKLQTYEEIMATVKGRMDHIKVHVEWKKKRGLLPNVAITAENIELVKIWTQLKKMKDKA